MFDIKRKKLVEQLLRDHLILTKDVEEAFKSVPRENFIPTSNKDFAYVDTPLYIGSGQTISAPHMIAIMCEILKLKKNSSVLEIGTGSGYHAAIVSKIIGDAGHVYSIERVPQLAEKAKKNLENNNIKNVTVEIGDGSEGLYKYSPYDYIYVTCAAPDIPMSLIEQLKDPGKLLVPVGRGFCILKLLEKREGKIITTDKGGCAFVLLIGKYGFDDEI
jgi:protein-L-isoaspartate(D-aspartate) O-methyltransferase